MADTENPIAEGVPPINGARVALMQKTVERITRLKNICNDPNTGNSVAKKFMKNMLDKAEFLHSNRDRILAQIPQKHAAMEANEIVNHTSGLSYDLLESCRLSCTHDERWFNMWESFLFSVLNVTELSQMRVVVRDSGESGPLVPTDVNMFLPLVQRFTNEFGRTLCAELIKKAETEARKHDQDGDSLEELAEDDFRRRMRCFRHGMTELAHEGYLNQQHHPNKLLLIGHIETWIDMIWCQETQPDLIFGYEKPEYRELLSSDEEEDTDEEENIGEKEG